MSYQQWDICPKLTCLKLVCREKPFPELTSVLSRRLVKITQTFCFTCKIGLNHILSPDKDLSMNQVSILPPLLTPPWRVWRGWRSKDAPSRSPPLTTGARPDRQGHERLGAAPAGRRRHQGPPHLHRLRAGHRRVARPLRGYLKCKSNQGGLTAYNVKAEEGASAETTSAVTPKAARSQEEVEPGEGVVGRGEAAGG